MFVCLLLELGESSLIYDPVTSSNFLYDVKLRIISNIKFRFIYFYPIVHDLKF